MSPEIMPPPSSSRYHRELPSKFEQTLPMAAIAELDPYSPRFWEVGSSEWGFDETFYNNPWSGEIIASISASESENSFLESCMAAPTQPWPFEPYGDLDKSIFPSFASSEVAFASEASVLPPPGHQEVLIETEVSSCEPNPPASSVSRIIESPEIVATKGPSTVAVFSPPAKISTESSFPHSSPLTSPGVFVSLAKYPKILPQFEQSEPQLGLLASPISQIDVPGERNNRRGSSDYIILSKISSRELQSRTGSPEMYALGNSSKQSQKLRGATRSQDEKPGLPWSQMAMMNTSGYSETNMLNTSKSNGPGSHLMDCPRIYNGIIDLTDVKSDPGSAGRGRNSATQSSNEVVDLTDVNSDTDPMDETNTNQRYNTRRGLNFSSRDPSEVRDIRNTGTRKRKRSAGSAPTSNSTDIDSSQPRKRVKLNNKSKKVLQEAVWKASQSNKVDFVLIRFPGGPVYLKITCSDNTCSSVEIAGREEVEALVKEKPLATGGVGKIVGHRQPERQSDCSLIYTWEWKCGAEVELEETQLDFDLLKKYWKKRGPNDSRRFYCIESTEKCCEIWKRF